MKIKEVFQDLQGKQLYQTMMGLGKRQKQAPNHKINNIRNNYNNQDA
jgi:hypothetical protein